MFDRDDPTDLLVRTRCRGAMTAARGALLDVVDEIETWRSIVGG